MATKLEGKRGKRYQANYRLLNDKLYDIQDWVKRDCKGLVVGQWILSFVGWKINSKIIRVPLRGWLE